MTASEHRNRSTLTSMLPNMGTAWKAIERDGWVFHERIPFDGSHERKLAGRRFLIRHWFAWPLSLPVVSSPWLSWDNFDGAVSHERRLNGSSEVVFELLNVLADRRPAGGDHFDPEDVDLVEAISAAAEMRNLEVVREMPGWSGGFRVLAHRATFDDLFDLPSIARLFAEVRSVAASGSVPVEPGGLDRLDQVGTPVSVLALAGVPILRGAYHDDDRRRALPAIANTLSLGFPPEAHIATVLGWDPGLMSRPRVLPAI